jgi:hypothetical protein
MHHTLGLAGEAPVQLSCTQILLEYSLAATHGWLRALTTLDCRPDSMLDSMDMQLKLAGADCNAERPMGTFVLNVTHVIGLFTYALVLGIVSDDVQQTVAGFKQGNSVVMERNHTVVLNVNNTTSNLLRQVGLPMPFQILPALLFSSYPARCCLVVCSSAHLLKTFSEAPGNSLMCDLFQAPTRFLFAYTLICPNTTWGNVGVI